MTDKDAVKCSPLGDPEDVRSDPLRFASLIAHQLQSPLNAISAALQTVLAEYTGPVSSRQRGPLEKADSRCSEAITAVRRMLAIIQAREAEAEVEVKPSELVSIISQMGSSYVADAASRDIAVDLVLQHEPVYVALNEPALVEVFRALLNNALKYTNNHGRIRLSIREQGAGGFAAVSVADSGIGIPEGEREHVFEPFYRSAAVKKSGHPGVGLGLAFVKSVVTAAGGNVHIEKSDLGGADFIVELPVTRKADSTEEGLSVRQPSMRAVIVGGVTAGPKAAAKIVRLDADADVTVIDRGSVMSCAGCALPHYLAGKVRERKGLMSGFSGTVRDPVFFQNVKNVHVMNQLEAVEIDRKGRRLRTHDLRSGREEWMPYDKLLLATGAEAIIPKTLDVTPVNVFTLQGVHDAEGIKTALAEGRATDVVIVGGGLIGVETTEALVKKGSRVTIVEKEPHILTIMDEDISVLVEKHLEEHGVRIATGTRAESFQGTRTVTAVVTDKGILPADMVILGVGVRPNVALAESAGLEIGETGAIRVDDRLRTSDPDIYAAGDCAETVHLVTKKPFSMPLGSTATKQGRVAAVNICGGDDVFEGVTGSCICKVFDFAVARTGLGESDAKDAGYDVVTVLVPGPDRAHYMPGVALVLLKLIVDRKSRRLLGAQATGAGAVDKRIDVAAMLIAAGATVDAMANADLCYAPSYSTAMDNMITAANVARNKLDGCMQGIASTEVHEMLTGRKDFVFLDVRTQLEYERVHLPHSVLIPLAMLRARIGEVPEDEPVVTFSSTSRSAYEAALILKSAGRKEVRVMDGGLVMWPYEKVE